MAHNAAAGPPLIPGDDGGLRRRYVQEGQREEDHALWQRDRIALRSVGIDIGSSTSHLIFSTLEMRRQGAVLSSRFELSRRRIDYRSDILITPFTGGVSIDTGRLSAFFERCYREAGLLPADVDTGAVITTGDAARKDNAEAIVRLFSEQAGHFVCASAGPRLEARMAAYGSGAVARSAALGDATLLNVDVGGGTTKLALVRDGAVIETAAINTGARLVTVDEHGRLTQVEDAARTVARHRGFALRTGQRLRPEIAAALAGALAESLLQAAARAPLSPLAADLMITGALRCEGPVQALLFSGGVSEYVYEVEARSYGDLGPLLGRRLRELLPVWLPGVPVERPAQGIRATVIGAAQFTAQVSGNTIYVRNPALLPLRNLQVVTLRFDAAEPSAGRIARGVTAALRRHDLAEGERPVALAVHWPHGPAWRHLDALSRGLAAALAGSVRRSLPVVVVLDCDVARLVGANLCEALGGYPDIVCLDGVQLEDLDYIDISREHADAGVVTVVIKSLVFTG